MRKLKSINDQNKIKHLYFATMQHIYVIDTHLILTGTSIKECNKKRPPLTRSVFLRDYYWGWRNKDIAPYLSAVLASPDEFTVMKITEVPRARMRSSAIEASAVALLLLGGCSPLTSSISDAPIDNKLKLCIINGATLACLSENLVRITDPATNKIEALIENSFRCKNTEGKKYLCSLRYLSRFDGIYPGNYNIYDYQIFAESDQSGKLKIYGTVVVNYSEGGMAGPFSLR